MRYRTPRNRLLIPATLLICVWLAAYAGQLSAIDFTTTAGRSFKNVTISRIEPDGIVVITRTGVIKLYFTELPQEIQQKYGFDPVKAEAFQAAEAQRRATPAAPAPAASAFAPPVQARPESQSTPIQASPPAAPRENIAAAAGGIVLDRSWEGPMQGDLRVAMTSHACWGNSRSRREILAQLQALKSTKGLPTSCPSRQRSNSSA